MTQAYNLSQLANNLTSAGLLDASDGLVNAVPVANGGTGATTASAARTNLGVAASAFSVPSGGIIMWSGSIASIPAGWFVCDGANGTPDLRNRFVIGTGYGADYAIGASGGSANSIVPSHTHTASSGNQSANHSHTFSTTTDSAGTHSHTVRLRETEGASFPSYGTLGAGNEATSQTTEAAGAHAHIVSGTTANNSANHNHIITVNTAGVSPTNANLPPYYALTYIMKS